jgi:hypothetical protein
MHLDRRSIRAVLLIICITAVRTRLVVTEIVKWPGGERERVTSWLRVQFHGLDMGSEEA